MCLEEEVNSNQNDHASDTKFQIKNGRKFLLFKLSDSDLLCALLIMRSFLSSVEEQETYFNLTQLNITPSNPKDGISYFINLKISLAAIN